MTTTPTTAAPDPVKVAREAAAQERNYEADAKLIREGQADFWECVRFAILGARAMQEAMPTQGGGEPTPKQLRDAYAYSDLICPTTHNIEAEILGVWRYLNGQVTRPAPEVKDATPGWPDPLESPLAQAIRDGKIDDVDIRDLFDKMERELQVLRRTGSYREVKPTPAPAAASEGLVERLRREGAHIRDKHRHVKAFYAMEEAAARIEADAAEMERKDGIIRAQSYDYDRACDERDAARARATAAEAERDALREAVTRCRDRFAEYRDLHMAKGTADGTDKAYRNAEMVVICQMALDNKAAAALRPAKGGRDGE